MLVVDDGRVWTKRRVRHLQEMSGVEGKTPGESVITSMGTTGPPSVEQPIFIVDYLVSDGAQVTRPSIDPYREPIETEIYLAGLKIRLSMPVILAVTPEAPTEYVGAFVRAAYNMGILTYVHDSNPPAEALEGYEESIITTDVTASGYAGYVGEKRPYNNSFNSIFLFRIPSTENHELVARAVEAGADAILVDEDLGGDVPLEIAVSEIDRTLKTMREYGDEPLRSRINLVACSSRIRGADDVFKLMGLGADCVALSKAFLIAAGLTAKSGKISQETVQERIENFLLALQKEIKLLAGAAGVSCLYTSLVGSRELFRAITLDRRIREKIGVKPAGVG